MKQDKIEVYSEKAGGMVLVDVVTLLENCGKESDRMLVVDEEE